MAVLGFNATAKRGDFDSAAELQRLPTVLDWAQSMNMATGLVTNTRVTHATPAAFYAASVDRKFECDAKMTRNASAKDIARQLVEDSPGKGLDVIMGGGSGALGRLPEGEQVDPWGCSRQDNADLVQKWTEMNNKKSRKFVRTKKELLEADDDDVDSILGLFSPSHMTYASDKADNSTEPSLAEMTFKAVRILSKSEEGFLLMVENGLIDLAHHMNWANKALEEVLALDEAVAAALTSVNITDTLILVTSDHSHTLSLSGSPLISDDIRGMSGPSKETQGVRVPTLSYANGPGGGSDFDVRKMTHSDFRHPSLVTLGSGTHGGEAVPVFAAGPMSYFVHGNHHQSFLAHVVGYSLCAGFYEDICRRRPQLHRFDFHHQDGSSLAESLRVDVTLLLLLLLFFVRFNKQ